MAACLICDDDGLISDQAGKTGTDRLHECLGHDARKSTTEAVRQAVAWGYLTRPSRPPGAILVCLSKLDPGRCQTCGQPAKANPCPKCARTILRDDRSWRGIALQTWATARANKLTEAQALYRIHAVTRIRLYGSTDRELQDGEPKLPSLVPWMVDQGLLDPVWLTYGHRAKGRKLEARTTHKGEAPEDWFEG